MKRSRVSVALAIGLCLLPGICRAQQFTTDYIDSMQLASWSRISPLKPTVASAVAKLRKGANEAALIEFAKIWERDKSDLRVVHGLALSAHASKKLPAYLKQQGNQIASLRQSGKTVPKALWFSVYYLGWMGEVLESSKNTARALYVPMAEKELAKAGPKDRYFYLMMASLKIALGEDGATRAWCERGLDLFPDFPELKLLLSQSYLRGTVEMWDSRGRPIPVPASERDDPKESARLALEVIAEAPDYDIAFYYAGLAVLPTDKRKAIRLLKRYLDSPAGSVKRRSRAHELVEKFSGAA